ncbi:MlaE family ABC transporter permease [Nocardioides daejeonensis]|uniref:MlaE family ABC transporter permease n=1 Tax=Nocardioides daejeonensis TaxID=1046556 RepID=UPI000D740221|nr:ABC transporter permease [Nocardioides daejeonensis]
MAKATSGLQDTLVRFGDFAWFSWTTFTGARFTLQRYYKEVLRQLADISWGTGALLVGGGTVGVMILLSLSAGTSLGIEGFNGLELLGLAPLTGFVSAGVNTRELAPLVAALALGGQVGCRFTAQIGSMRISEEIDALEVMAVEPMRYLVSTRVLAAMFAILPLYLIGLLGAYAASELSVVVLFDQSRGTYEHYFYSFIDARDIFYSVVKILVFSLVVALIHCWYGYRAGSGPQGVGEATGRAIRASIVSVVLCDMIMTLAFWGSDPGFRVAG